MPVWSSPRRDASQPTVVCSDSPGISISRYGPVGPSGMTQRFRPVCQSVSPLSSRALEIAGAFCEQPRRSC